MSKEKDEKDLLLRSLITKMCTEKQYIDVKYEKEFFGEQYLLFQKINSRKKDIPSIDYLVDTLKFEPVYNNYTITDTIERLNKVYYSERSTQILRSVIADRKASLDTNDINESLDNLNKEFAKIRGVLANAHVVELESEPEKIVEEYRKLLEETTLIKTGLDRLDEVAKPKAGNFLLLCAGTSQGKSLLMTLMQNTAIKNGIPSLLINLEMTLVEIINRLISAAKIANFEDLDNFKYTPKQYGELIEKLKAKNTHVLTMDTEARIDLQTVERYIQETKPKVVFLDYMTLLQGSDFSWNAATSVSAELKRMALQYKVLMITAAQADTSALSAGEIPEMWNTRGNKSYAHDANIFVGFASERKLTDPDTLRFKFSIRKNRNGPLMDFGYDINPVNGHVRDITDDLFNGL